MIKNEHMVLLVYCGFVKGTEDRIKKSKHALSPNDKAADVATKGKLKKVEGRTLTTPTPGKLRDTLTMPPSSSTTRGPRRWR